VKYLNILCLRFQPLQYMFSTEQCIWPKLPGKILTENHILYEQDSNFQRSTGNLIKHIPLCHNSNDGKKACHLSQHKLLYILFKRHFNSTWFVLRMITCLFSSNAQLHLPNAGDAPLKILVSELAEIRVLRNSRAIKIATPPPPPVWEAHSGATCSDSINMPIRYRGFVKVRVP
jgi:hypothetical protein